MWYWHRKQHGSMPRLRAIAGLREEAPGKRRGQDSVGRASWESHRKIWTIRAKYIGWGRSTECARHSQRGTPFFQRKQNPWSYLRDWENTPMPWQEGCWMPGGLAGPRQHQALLGRPSGPVHHGSLGGGDFRSQSPQARNSRFWRWGEWIRFVGTISAKEAGDLVVLGVECSSVHEQLIMSRCPQQILHLRLCKLQGNKRPNRNTTQLPEPTSQPHPGLHFTQESSVPPAWLDYELLLKEKCLPISRNN